MDTQQTPRVLSSWLFSIVQDAQLVTTTDFSKWLFNPNLRTVVPEVGVNYPPGGNMRFFGGYAKPKPQCFSVL